MPRPSGTVGTPDQGTGGSGPGEDTPALGECLGGRRTRRSRGEAVRGARKEGCLKRTSLFVALMLLPGCRADAGDALVRDRYVDLMVALRELARDSDVPEEFYVRKDSVLRAAGVTDSMLVAYARRHGRDVAYMAAVWDSVAQRLIDGDTIMR